MTEYNQDTLLRDTDRAFKDVSNPFIPYVNIINQETPLLASLKKVQCEADPEDGTRVHKVKYKISNGVIYPMEDSDFVPSSQYTESYKMFGVTRYARRFTVTYDDYMKKKNKEAYIAKEHESLKMELHEGFENDFFNRTAASARTAPTGFLGLGALLNDLNKTNVTDGKGTGNTNLTSFYFVDEIDGANLIYPASENNGLKMSGPEGFETEMGKNRATGEDGVRLSYWRKAEMSLGMAIVNPKRIARICNVNINDASTLNFDMFRDILVKSFEKRENNVSIYCSLDGYLVLQRMFEANPSARVILNNLSSSAVGLGNSIYNMRVKTDRFILDNEQRVVAKA